jgi:indolepyruvate ferredoxin oxidoreductase beta subunit
VNPIDDLRDRSGWRILIAGTGGQGVLTAARVLCDCFVELEHKVVSGQLHGMAQRGGAVQATVIIDGGISPVIPKGRADYVLGLEPVETTRALPWMSPRTVVFMNTTPVIPFVLAQQSILSGEEVKYPDVNMLLDSIRAVSSSVIAFDAAQCARDAGSTKSLNVVMLGCLLGSGALPCTAEGFWDMVSSRMPAALRESNRRAFFRGTELAAEVQTSGGTR